MPLSKTALTKALLSLLGMVIAAYLLLTEPSNASSGSALFFCPGQSQRSIINCTAVITSRYSHILGVPLSLLALVLFATLFALSILQERSKAMGFLSAYLSIASIFAVFYSAFAMSQIGHICIYCFTLDILLIVISAIGFVEAKKLAHSLMAATSKQLNK